jgi:proline iminopeptidase
VSELDFVPRTLWRRGQITLDGGVRLAYDVAGAGQLLVFLGDGPGDGPGYLLPLADSVGVPGWRRVVFHQRGTGRSPVPLGTPLSVRQAADDVALLADHLGADSMVLVGHGYGGNLALLAAALRPDLVSAAVLVAPGPLDSDLSARCDAAVVGLLDEADRQALRAAESCRDTAAAQGNWPVMHAAVLEVMRLRAPAYVRSPAARERWQRELSEEFDHDPYTHTALTRSLAALNQHAVARAVRCPVHILQGSEDFAPTENLETLRSLLPHATVSRIDGAAHLPWLDRPEAVAASVRDFLLGLGAPGS